MLPMIVVAMQYWLEAGTLPLSTIDQIGRAMADAKANKIKQMRSGLRLILKKTG